MRSNELAICRVYISEFRTHGYSVHTPDPNSKHRISVKDGSNTKNYFCFAGLSRFYLKGKKYYHNKNKVNTEIKIKINFWEFIWICILIIAWTDKRVILRWCEQPKRGTKSRCRSISDIWTIVKNATPFAKPREDVYLIRILFFKKRSLNSPLDLNFFLQNRRARSQNTKTLFKNRRDKYRNLNLFRSGPIGEFMMFSIFF